MGKILPARQPASHFRGGRHSSGVSVDPTRLPLENFLSEIIWVGIAGGIIGLTATLAMGSSFWQSYTPESPYPAPLPTPNAGLTLPELSGFLYNDVGVRPSELGLSPWHDYFTSVIPKVRSQPLHVYIKSIGHS